MEELIVKNVEETPLSQGVTLTELKERLDRDEFAYLKSKYGTILGFGAAGALALGTIVATVATHGNVGPLFAGISTVSAATLIGTSSWKWLATDKCNYEESYKAYYNALKNTNSINELEKESRGMKK